MNCNQIKLLSRCLLVLLCITACTSMPFKDNGLNGDKKTDKSLAMLHYSLGIKSSLNDDLDGAITDIEKALHYDARSSFLATELANLYIEKGDSKKAQQVLEKSLRYNPDESETHFLLGKLYLNAKDYKRAIREYKKVIKIDSQNTMA